MKQDYCPYCMSAINARGRCPECGNVADSYTSPPHHLPPGTRLHDNQYVVGRALGNGCFGITYIGRHLKLDSKVAIKEYYPEGQVTRTSARSLEVSSYATSADNVFERNRERFIREARILASLEKLHVVVEAHDYFEENGTAYLVMEFVDGTTLEDLALQSGGRIEPTEFFDLIGPLFPALEKVHNAGLLHRDISPYNLMLEHGHIRLIDFGCSGEGAATAMFTGGKNGYVPPEQRVGRGCGPWTDVYALCATIYRCLTGITPPDSVSRSVLDELKPPRELGINITEAQELALMRGLQVAIGARLKSINELEEAICTTEESPNRRRLTSAGVAITIAVACALAILILSHPWGQQYAGVAKKDGNKTEEAQRPTLSVSSSKVMPFSNTGSHQFAPAKDESPLKAGEAFSLVSFLHSTGDGIALVELSRMEITELEPIEVPDLHFIAGIKDGAMFIYAVNNGWGQLDESWSLYATAPQGSGDPTIDVSDLCSQCKAEDALRVGPCQIVEVARLALDPEKFATHAESSSDRSDAAEFEIHGDCDAVGISKTWTVFLSGDCSFGLTSKIPKEGCGEPDKYSTTLVAAIDIDRPPATITFTGAESCPLVDGKHCVEMIVAPTKSCRLTVYGSFQYEGSEYRTNSHDLEVIVPAYNVDFNNDASWPGGLLESLLEEPDAPTERLTQIGEVYRYNADFIYDREAHQSPSQTDTQTTSA